MSDKYYVIPIDAQANAYLGVKARVNPYSGRKSYCAGCPNLFGGNADGRDARDTVYVETLEESHHKITLPDNGMLRTIHAAEDGNNNMEFYAMLIWDQSYDASVTLRPEEAARPAYRETTGEVLRVNLRQLDKDNRHTAFQQVINTLNAEPDPEDLMEFLNSHSFEALHLAAKMMQGERW
jgi:hypothetical protein